jgi:molybdate/tungstate transport system ATP-binding protein
MIEFKNICILQGGFALTDVSFVIPEGAYCVLMGQTGCGKTTLLEILCGLRKPLRGGVGIQGREVTRLPPGARQIGYVPQDLVLFPHLCVREQLAFALHLRHWTREQMSTRIGELAHRLGIQSLLDRDPAHLSGGEAQRVALGRALAPRPDILCLDEPLSALDEETHSSLLELLGTLHRDETPTVLHVTHRRSEAQQLATHILTLHQGAVTLQEREFPHAHGL